MEERMKSELGFRPCQRSHQMVPWQPWPPYSRHIGQYGPTWCNDQRARWGNISSWHCTVGSGQTWGSLSKAWLHYAPKYRHWLETLLLAMFTWFILYETTVDLARVASPEGCLSGRQVHQPSLKTWVWKKNNPWGLSIYLSDRAREKRRDETRADQSRREEQWEQWQKSLSVWSGEEWEREELGWWKRAKNLVSFL